MRVIANKPVISIPAIRRLEYIYTLLGLLFFSSGLLTILKSSGSDSIVKPLRYSFLAISIVLIFQNSKNSSLAFKEGRWTMPLILLTTASFIWSVASSLTMQSLRAQFIPITIFGIYLAVRYSHRQMFKVLYSYAFLTLLISLFYIFAMPAIGKHPVLHAYPGAWKGIFIHKNLFGFNLSILSTFLALKMLYEDKKHLWRWGIYLLITCISIIFSQSLGALIISVLTLFLIWLYRKYKWKGKISVLILQCCLMLSVFIGGVISILWAPIMSSLGKSPTIGGRTLIWEFLLNKVSTVPFLGYGRASFWKVPSLFNGIYQATGDVPANAHNGYIEILLDIGYIGLFFFIISAIFATIKTLKLAYQANRVEDLWPLAFMLLFLIWNINESLLLKGSSFPWLIFVFISFSPFVNRKVKPKRIKESIYGI